MRPLGPCVVPWVVSPFPRCPQRCRAASHPTVPNQKKFELIDLCFCWYDFSYAPHCQEGPVPAEGPRECAGGGRRHGFDGDDDTGDGVVHLFFLLEGTKSKPNVLMLK